MATTFPGTLDNFTNPQATDKLNNPSHSSQHTNVNDAMEAVQAYLGVASSVSMSTITGRVVALEAGGGGVSPEEVQDIVAAMLVEGTGIDIVYNDVLNTLTISTVNMVTTNTVQDITGAKTFTKPVVFEDALGNAGSISVVPDPNSTIGETLLIESAQGVTIGGPYVVLDTGNLQIGYAGATSGQLLNIAGVDSFGVATIGLVNPPPAAYSVTDTHNANVIIKAGGTTPPTAWIPLQLSVTLGADAPAGTATVMFEVELSNPTTRSGVVEWGMTVNGSAPLAREIVTQIAPNFLQTVALSIPLQNGYVTGDVIALVARVTTNDNDQFSLTAVASPSSLSLFRFSVIGATGSLPAPDNMVTTDTPQTITGQKTFTQTILGTVTDAEEVPWNGVQNKPTEFPPSAHGHVIADVANLQATLNNKLGVNDNAISATTATVASAVDDLNSANVVKQWIGTEAQYIALGTYDPYTYYAITDGQTPGGGGSGTSVAWDDITNKPTTFPPSAHNQAISTITGLQTALDSKLATTAAAASVVDQGAGASLKLWYGTEAQYTAIGIKDATTLYFRSA